jgi:ABC-2 type transport system ATP-binding protein
VVIINRGRIVAAGEIDELRAASTRRHLEVEVTGNANAWLAGRTDLAVVERSGDLARLLVPADLDLGAVLAAASAAGPVARFSFQPPTLSELFMEAVQS